MKPSLEIDFTVSVKHQVWEELPEVAEFYQGIYSVTLNFLVTVMFVPEVKITGDDWFSNLPKNFDEVTSELEARLVTVALSDYTVIANSLLAGQQELITLPLVSNEMKNANNVIDEKLVSYVKPEEFEIFSKELSWLAQQTPGVHDYVRISKIENLDIAKFIVSNLIGSNNFLVEHLRILGREYQYAPTKLALQAKL